MWMLTECQGGIALMDNTVTGCDHLDACPVPIQQGKAPRALPARAQPRFTHVALMAVAAAAPFCPRPTSVARCAHNLTTSLSLLCEPHPLAAVNSAC